jgi:hypothetical protein
MASGLGALLSILGGAGGAYYDIQTAKEREAIRQNELAQQRADAEQERRDRLAAAAQALGMQKQTLFANLAERGFTAGSQNQALAGALNQPGTALPGGDIGAISDMAQKAVAAAQASRGQSLALQLPTAEGKTETAQFFRPWQDTPAGMKAAESAADFERERMKKEADLRELWLKIKGEKEIAGIGKITPEEREWNMYLRFVDQWMTTHKDLSGTTTVPTQSDWEQFKRTFGAASGQSFEQRAGSRGLTEFLTPPDGTQVGPKKSNPPVINIPKIK